VREHDVHVRPGAKAVVTDDLVSLLELTREGLVGEVVQLRELGQAIDRDDDASAQITRVLTPDAIAGVVRDDVEPHRHAVAPPCPCPCAPGPGPPSRWLIRLDAANPLSASRSSTAFETWRRLDPGRQALARGELDRIGAAPGLSNNLSEMVARMLA